jgi:hypothetical protein
VGNDVEAGGATRQGLPGWCGTRHPATCKASCARRGQCHSASFAFLAWAAVGGMSVGGMSVGGMPQVEAMTKGLWCRRCRRKAAASGAGRGDPATLKAKRRERWLNVSSCG